MSLYSRLKLASSLSGGSSASTPSSTSSAVAVSDSADGIVTVEFDDGSQMEVPTVGAVSEGDDVQLIVSDSDAVAIGAGGWGDAVQVGIEAAQTIAEEAQAAAEATNQHFWADGNGAHITTEADDAEAERNVLLNSLGLLFRRFSNYVATLTESAVSFWDGSGNDGSHILAFLGKDGSRIGDAESANTIVTDSGFSVRTGAEQRVTMGVNYTAWPDSGGRFRKRKVGRVYIAGYMDPYSPYIDRDAYGSVKMVPLTDPGARLFIGNYDPDEGAYWVSDGQVAGISLPLMSIDELIETSGDYLAAGDISDAMEGFYSREVVTEHATETASYFIGYDGGSGNPLSSYLMEFDAETLAAIPRDTWTPEAVAHGAPNWFIGSIYEDGVPFAAVDGVPFVTASDIADMATKTDLASKLEAPLLTVANVSYTTASIANNNGVSSSIKLAGYVPDGYTAIGIVGQNLDHSQNWYTNAYVNVSTQTLHYGIKHAFGSAAETCTVQWKVLCVKSGIYENTAS